MPFEITIQCDIIFFRLYGVVTAADLDQIASDVEVMEDSLPIAMDRITDITSVERFDVGFPAVNILASRLRDRQFPRTIKSAIIVAEAVQFGLARMYQTLNENPQMEIRIVHSLNEARDWIANKAEKGTS
jgi:hypothetical protein